MKMAERFAGGISYVLTRKRVKNINLRITPQGQVSVSAPYGVPAEYIDGFVAKKREFILSALARAEARARRRERGGAWVFGAQKTVSFLKGTARSSRINGGVIYIYCRDPEDESSRQRAFSAFWKSLCLQVCTEKARKLYPLFRPLGVDFPEIRVKNMKSRWGSCTPSKNTVTFSTGLLEAPEECVDYVVLHEFCHFICPNHSPDFYRLVGSLMPDWKRRQDILRRW